MAVPDFEALMLPILRLLSEARDVSAAQLREHLIASMSLTQADLYEVTPLWRKQRLTNRMGWAMFYLRGAGLAESVSRGVYRITEQGQRLLASAPRRVDVSFLNQLPGFSGWRHKARRSGSRI